MDQYGPHDRHRNIGAEFVKKRTMMADRLTQMRIRTLPGDSTF